MIDPVTLFQEGGPFVYLVLWAGMGNALLALAYVSVAVRRRAPAGLVLMPALLPLLFGVLGSQLGLLLAADALAHASAETKLALMANGIHVANFTTLGALLVNLQLLGPATLGAWVGVFTRWSAPPDEALSTRAAALLLLLATLGTLGWHAAITGESMALRAVAMASAETRPQLVAEAIATTRQSLTWLAAASGAGLLVGLGLIAPVVSAGTRRTWVEIGASVVVAACLLATPLLSQGGRDAQALVDEQVEREQRPYRPLRDLGLELPTTDDCLWWSELHTARVSVGAEATQVDGVNAGKPDGPIRDGVHWPIFEALDAIASTQAQAMPDFPFSGVLTADFARDAPWSSVRPVLAAAVGARYGKVRLSAVRSDGDLCFVEAALEGTVHPTAGTRASAPPPEPHLADGFVQLEVPQPDADRVVVRVVIGDPVPEAATVVELVPRPDTPMQDVAAAVAEISTFRQVVLVTSRP